MDTQLEKLDKIISKNMISNASTMLTIVLYSASRRNQTIKLHYLTTSPHFSQNPNVNTRQYAVDWLRMI